jgi:hypothetical protein
MTPVQQSGTVQATGRLTPRLATLAAGGLLGILALIGVLQVQNADYKTWVVLTMIAVLPTVAAVSGRPKELLLFGWVISLTYNRQYFIFESLVGYQGTEGPYVPGGPVRMVAVRTDHAAASRAGAKRAIMAVVRTLCRSMLPLDF